MRRHLLPAFHCADVKMCSAISNVGACSHIENTPALNLEPPVFRTYLEVSRLGVARLKTTYSVDCSARVVFTSISGPLTLGDLIALGDALRKDPSFDPTFDELLEVSPGSAVDLRYADVQAATTADPFSKQSRRAIVVHTEVDFGVARMYELMHGGHIHVFRSLETAREFLGLNGA